MLLSSTLPIQVKPSGKFQLPAYLQPHRLFRVVWLCFLKFFNSWAVVALTETMIAYRVDISNFMEVSIMGRKLNQARLEDVLQTIREHDGHYKANDVAKELDLHPQTVARLLSAAETAEDSLLCEDERGFLSIFKKWW
jgi:hypothetical protein